MPEPKRTIPVNASADAAEEPSSAAPAPAGAREDAHAAQPGSVEGAAPSGDGDGDGDGAGPAQPDGAAELQGDLDELGALAAKRDEYLALAQRTQADFENYRKRVARESALAQERGVARLAKELLPAIDNLDRALDAAATDDPLLEGVRLVRSELSAALARAGVESFSPLGETFDPAVHEAMATVKSPARAGGEDGQGGAGGDGRGGSGGDASHGAAGATAASGTVVEVYQPGYRLGDSIIRPARVVVAA
jgi:molecular chaperone GrpE